MTSQLRANTISVKTYPIQQSLSICTLAPLFLLGACGQKLSGEDGLRAEVAHLNVCEGFDGFYAYAMLETNAKCDQAVRARDTGCAEWHAILASDPHICSMHTEGSFLGNTEQGLYVAFEAVNPDDLTESTWYMAYNYECTGTDADGAWITETKTQTGYAEISQDQGDSATLVLDLDGVQGTVSLAVCR